MKLRISAKLASVHSEVNVTDLEEKTVFTTKTDPLSAPRCTRLYDAEGVELAHYETTRTDEKDRAYSVSIDGGVSFTTKRSFRVSSRYVRGDHQGGPGGLDGPHAACVEQPV
ncbi:MAG: hypothetical protein ACLTSX_03585 [Collinsella sp.]